MANGVTSAPVTRSSRKSKPHKWHCGGIGSLTNCPHPGHRCGDECVAREGFLTASTTSWNLPQRVPENRCPIPGRSDKALQTSTLQNRPGVSRRTRVRLSPDAASASKQDYTRRSVLPQSKQPLAQDEDTKRANQSIEERRSTCPFGPSSQSLPLVVICHGGSTNALSGKNAIFTRKRVGP